MKRFLTLVVTIILFSGLHAQINRYGVPFITSYPTQMTPGGEQNWCIEKDIFGNMYFGTQDRGVVKYDGTKWSKIDINKNTRMYSLESDNRGIVYVGAAYEFGYIQPDEKGSPEYISLVGRIDSLAQIPAIMSIEIVNNEVFFQAPKYIFKYNPETDQLSKINLAEYGTSNSMRLESINGRIILADYNARLYELKADKFVPLPGNDPESQKTACTILLPYSESEMLVATFFDGLFLYDFNTGQKNERFYDSNFASKLEGEYFYAAVKINDDLFAIGTTNGQGILFIDGRGRLVLQLNKSNSDLPDNTILALYTDPDADNELWVASTGFISKIYINEPLTKFDQKQGIETTVNDIAIFKGDIYLSTDGGILKSYTDTSNILRFKLIPGFTPQVFPIQPIKSSNGDFLLAGSLEGLFKIDSRGRFQQIEKICKNLPGGPEVKLNVKAIVQSAIDPDIIYLGLEIGGVYILRMEGNNWRFVNKVKGVRGLVNRIVEKKDGGFWFFTDDPDGILNAVVSGKDTTIVKYGPEKGVPDVGLNSMNKVDDNLYITTTRGILKYDYSSDKFVSGSDLTGGYSEGKHSVNLFEDDQNDLWYSGSMDNSFYEMFLRRSGESFSGYRGFMNILPNVPSLGFLSEDDRVFMTKSRIVAIVNKGMLYPDTSKVNTHFASITVGPDTIFMGSFPVSIDSIRRLPVTIYPYQTVPVYSYDVNEISFEWTTPQYVEELRTEYSYMLEGYEETWSKWEGISFGYNTEALYPKKDYYNLPYGHYTFRVRTRTMSGQEGNTLEYEFIIAKPWYATRLAYVLFAMFALLAIWGIIAAYTRRLKNENIRLEGIVAERTAVVVKQKEELESSIHYASRIQMALLPSESILSDNIKNYFILFKPRDIVSGDYYWMMKKNERLYIVAADCTGHGVPGAFMSLLGMSFLDEIVDKESSPRADFILNEMRLHVTESLKQSGEDDEAKDGMDMALLVIDFNTRRIEFSGAYNPCFKVRKLTESEIEKFKDTDASEMPDGSMSNGKYLLETIYASKMPIGISSRMDEDFVFYDWSLEKGISYYLFSDGYIDQFGGPHGRKFMKKNFKRLILDIQDYPMARQKELLDKNLKEWMGESPQIDDILVMGIRTE